MTRNLSRRTFLLGAAAAGAAAAATGMVATGQTALKPAPRGEKRGYHATEHVNSYYRTTKV